MKSVTSKKDFVVRRMFTSDKNNFVVIELANALATGDYQLQLQYDGNFMFEDNAIEFFLHYTDSNNVTR